MNRSAYCITADNLSKTFPCKGREKRTLFHGFSLRIKPGEIVGLTGSSGSGKTTLGDILLGLKYPDTGKVYWNGRGIDSSNKKRRPALRPFFQKIYQDPPTSFPPHQTIIDSLSDVARHKNPDETKDMIYRRIFRAILKVGLSGELLKRHPGRLSGGEIQRFALSRILLLEPTFLVADEPTSRLDPSVQARIVRLLMRLARERRIGVLFISHDKELLRVACNMVISLEDYTS